MITPFKPLALDWLYYSSSSLTSAQVLISLCSRWKRGDNCKMPLDIGLKGVPYQKKLKREQSRYQGFPYSYLAYPSVVRPPRGVQPPKYNINTKMTYGHYCPRLIPCSDIYFTWIWAIRTTDRQNDARWSFPKRTKVRKTEDKVEVRAAWRLNGHLNYLPPGLLCAELLYLMSFK